MIQEIIISDLREDNFVIEKGEAKAILPEEECFDYYKWAFTKRREYDIIGIIFISNINFIIIKIN